MALACQLAVVTAWAVLLWGTAVPPRSPLGPETMLCAVTLLAAISCWARVWCTAADRAAWACMAVGISGYAVGFSVLFGVSAGEAGGPFGLNWSDCFSLLLYPAGYASLLLLTRSRVRSWSPSALLDVGVVALATSAVAVAGTAAAYPTLLVGSWLNVVYALAYPVGGATLLVVALTGVAMTRWQLDSTWALILLAFAAMTAGDAVYGLQSVAGTFRFGTPVDAAYTAGPVLVALAAWRRPGGALRRAGNGAVVMVVPGVATVVALVLLVADHGVRIPTVAVGLAAAAVLLSVVRTASFLRQERQLVQSRRDAETDHLTGLPNRRALLALLRQRMTTDWAHVDLVLIDLDGFKEVNDTLGHGAGDRLLVEVADRLRAAGCAVARLGGDEFALLLDLRAGDPQDTVAAVRASITRPVLLDGCRVLVGASLGMAGTAGESAPERLTPEELLRRADVALYRAKRRRSGIESWHADLDVGARDRLQLLADFRLALLDDGQLLAHHQPQVHPRTREVVAIEALVRWQHPRRGLLAPGHFLEAVEQAGLLPQLTTRVLQLVLDHQRTALSRGAAPPISVNLGAPDLLEPDFAARVGRMLRAHDVPASSLRFEVTEGVVMSDPDRILLTLDELRSLGIVLSLDDYGTGLSSLSYLRCLPIDELKIDRSFVQQLCTDPATALIVGSTIALAHGLGLTVVAEGVEDQATLDALAAAGCDLVQGYLVGRPAAPTALPHVPEQRRAVPDPMVVRHSG